MANKIQAETVDTTYQINKLVNLLEPARASVSSCKKVRTGEVFSLVLVEVGDGALAGLVEPELALGGTRERRQRKR